MPEIETIEPVVKEAPEYVPPQVPPTKEKVNRGDIFRKNLVVEKQKERGETETPVPTPTVETPKAPEPEVKPEVKDEPKPEVKTETPKSPLDVVTADQKEAPKEEEDDVLKGFDENKPDWKKAREVMKTQSREKRELAKTIAELKQTPKSDPEEIARLKQQVETQQQALAEREELIKSVDVRLSEDYRTLAKKRDDTVQKIADRAKSYGVDPAALISALALPEGRFKTEQIDGLMAEVAPSYKTKIDVLIEKLDEHNEAIFDFEKDAPKKYEELQAKREAAQREQQEAAVKNIQSEFTKISETLPADIVTLREVPEDVPGGTEWNQAIRNARENALRILSPGGSDFNESASVAVKGAHYDALMNMFLSDHKELVDARKRLAEYDSGGPDFKGGDKPKSEPKLSPSQKFNKALAEIKGSSQDD